MNVTIQARQKVREGVVGLLYMLLIGIPLCFACVLTGLILVAFGALLSVTVIFLPIGVPMIAVGVTAIALGTKYLTLPNRRRA